MNPPLHNPAENSLTFGMAVLMSSNFLRPPNNQITYTPNKQLSSFEKKLDTEKMAWTMTYQKYQTPNNLAYPKFETKDGTFGTSKFQTPNNLVYFKLQTPNKHITSAPPFQKLRSSLLGYTKGLIDNENITKNKS